MPSSKTKTKRRYRPVLIPTVEFTTINGEHMLRRMEPADSTGVANSLFELTDSEGNRLGFTGAELSSLATQWRSWCGFLREACPEQGITDPRTLDTRRRMGDIAHAIDERLPQGWTFLVLVAPVTPPGAKDMVDPAAPRCNYTSNMRRADALNLLKEFLLRNGAAEDWMKDIQ